MPSVKSIVRLALVAGLLIAPPPTLAMTWDNACQALDSAWKVAALPPIVGMKGFHNLDVLLALDCETPRFKALVDDAVAAWRAPAARKSGQSADRSGIGAPGGGSEASVPAPGGGQGKNTASASEKDPASPGHAGSATSRKETLAEASAGKDQMRDSDETLGRQPKPRETIPKAAVKGDGPKAPPKAQDRTGAIAKKGGAAAVRPPSRPEVRPCDRLAVALSLPRTAKRVAAVDQTRTALVAEYRERLRQGLQIVDVDGCTDYASKTAERSVVGDAGGGTCEAARAWATYYRNCLAQPRATVGARNLHRSLARSIF